MLARTMNLIEALLPSFTLIFTGHLICRFTKLNRDVWRQIDAVVYYLFFPLLLFYAITKTRIDLAAASELVIAGLLLAAVTIGVALSIPHWPVWGRHIDRRDHAANAQVGFRFNSFIALGIVSQSAGDAGMLALGVLIGVCVPVLNMAAVFAMARQGDLHWMQQLRRNPLVWATIGGLVFNVVGLSVPHWLSPTLGRMGDVGLVLGLMAAGAGMKLMDLRSAKLLALSVLMVRHLVAPLTAAGLVLMFKFDATTAMVLLTFAAVPTASSGYVLAASMGYNGGLVAAVITLSTLAALASLPFSLAVLLPLVS
jgi:predicted permease